MSHYRNKILLAVLVLTICTAILYLLYPASDVGSKQDAQYAQNLELAQADPTLSREQDGLHSIDTEELLEDYLNWAQYPPNSRPLRREHVDVLQYHWIPVPARPIVVPGDGETVEDTGIACRLQPARSHLTENEVIHIVLYCETAEKPEQGRNEIKIRSYKLMHSRVDESLPVNASKITVNDLGNDGDEEAGDNLYTFQFTPDRNDWGDMYLEVTVEIAGRPSGETHIMKTHFFSSPIAPAKFTGNFREGVRDGSLVIAVELLVETPGRYTIEANLFADINPELPGGPTQAEADAEIIGGLNTEEIPVGFARVDARLTRGLQWVDLTYFGKVLHDSNEDGPYVLRGLRGTQDTSPIDPVELDADPETVEAYLTKINQTEPLIKKMPYWAGTYVTNPYALDEFSRAEYNGPEKQDRIEHLKQQIAGPN